ncbi:hypothetical protein PVK06_005169 [Gossypium arboreum]|uniref:Reverse transcriptase zinc-binding domain-containing protein n=1 Tax=Gossypium arboreum TaxID=29729 RepID=A0ABR0QUZ1_GOSAR|nr:hypothetical protein PVK06_005169 [Gossypium arboreum]
MCPRCGVGEEHSYHIFRQCPTVREIWSSLNLSWGIPIWCKILMNGISGFLQEVPRNSARCFAVHCSSYEAQGISFSMKGKPFYLRWEKSSISLGGGGSGPEGVLKASKTTLHENISSPFVAEAYAGLEAITSENFQAHNLAKGALEKREESYLVKERRSHNIANSEGRWREEPD